MVGSEDYADFREQLLTWEECQPQLQDYAGQMGMAATASGFVEQLQTWLTSVAVATDEICKDGTQVTISKEGEPVLKRITAAPLPTGALELEAAILGGNAEFGENSTLRLKAASWKACSDSSCKPCKNHSLSDWGVPQPDVNQKPLKASI